MMGLKLELSGSYESPSPPSSSFSSLFGSCFVEEIVGKPESKLLTPNIDDGLPVPNTNGPEDDSFVESKDFGNILLVFDGFPLVELVVIVGNDIVDGADTGGLFVDSVGLIFGTIEKIDLVGVVADVGNVFVIDDCVVDVVN